MNGKDLPLKNGTRSVEDSQISSILEKKNKVLQQVDLRIAAAQTNGNDEAQFIQYQVQNSFHVSTSNGNCMQNNEQNTNQLNSYNMEEEEEEILDSEEEYLEDDDPLGVIVGAYSLNEYEENENTSGSDTSLKGNFVVNDAGEPISMQSQATDINDGKTNGCQEKVVENNSIQKPNTVTSNDLEVDLLSKTRASAREHLHQLSQSICSSIREKQPLRKSDTQDSSLIKRLLDTSSLMDSSCEHKNKSRKLDNSIVISHSDSLHNLEKCEEESLGNAIKHKLSRNKESTSTGIMLSQSIGETSKPLQKEDFSHCKYSSNTKLIPHLNPTEGYFHIGPKKGEKEEEFLFSVSIIYAKNLSKIIPKDTLSSLNEGYRFCYSLLGYPIYTDPFLNLDDPEFVAEKASAKICSSHKSLSLYFGQHPFLPVYFMCGEETLGVCNVDIGFLMDIASQRKVKFEDVYEVNPMGNETSSSKNDNKHKAMIAISFEVLKSNSSNSTNDISSLVESVNHMESNYNEVYVSDSASSSSELNEDYKPKNKVRKNRRRYSLKNYLSEEKALNSERTFETEKKKMLLEAAYEIEQWKEEKQKLFLKDWSAKEETLQKLVATEWSSKIKIIEEELSHRLTVCDQLQEKLNKGLAELSLREENFKLKESQVKRLEVELVSEKEKLQSVKLKEACHDKETLVAAAAKEIYTKHLDLEKSKNIQLEKEVRKLQEELRNANENLNIQSQEVINLRRKLILSDDIIGVTKEKENFQNKIDYLQDRKRYYKAQWLSTLTDLHKVYSAHKRTVEEITSDIKKSTLERAPYDEQASSSSSITGIKLKKLKDERQILLESGFYSSNHSIIKNIDKKIKDLIG